MCGINGFNFKDEDIIKKMNLLTRHRGPDDEGIYFDEHVSLGHNRLSIIDLSPLGRQPMESSDGKLVIVFNGEIYNFLEIKEELKSHYSFRTKTDTEVILASYERWGQECVKRLNGIFAFAIWDREKREFFIARDHLGVKPLYYFYDQKKFIFSSEIKSILAHPFNKKLNRDALNVYFRLLYIPEPLTPWEKIYKLPPAHYLILNQNGARIEKYWEINKFDGLKNKQEALELIKKEFLRSVKSQLISDRPLGLYLSGGIDSTALLGVMSKLTEKPVETFSVGFDVDVQREKFNADFELAKKTSAYYESKHHEVMLKPQDVIQNFEKIVWHMDDLVANHTQSAMFVLSKITKEHVAVALSGDGGDELFLGYDRYYLNYILDKIQLVPKSIRENFIVKNIFRAFGREDIFYKLNVEKGLDRFLAFMSQKENQVRRFLNKDFNNEYVTPEFLGRKFFSGRTYLNSTRQLQYLDIKTWLLDDALARSDRMSMAHGLEQRVPFLDKDLVELAFRVPVECSLDNVNRGKRIFREALLEYMPDFILSGPKRGWFSPMAKWVRGGLRQWAEEILSEGYFRKSKDFLDFKQIDIIFRKHLSGEEYAVNTIWSLLTFQIWLKQFYD